MKVTKQRKKKAASAVQLTTDQLNTMAQDTYSLRIGSTTMGQYDAYLRKYHKFSEEQQVDPANGSTEDLASHIVRFLVQHVEGNDLKVYCY